MPKRIKRQRTKGWRMPAGTVNVCRAGLHRGKFGNPFRIGDYAMVGDPDPRRAGPFQMSYCITTAQYADSRYTHIKDAATAVDLYQRYRECYPLTDAEVDELDGHDVACFCNLCDRHRDGRPRDCDCPDCPPCHGDVILKLVKQARS